ncbi:Hcp family type VI secretion system effector [Yersinia mollaretii]|uniref:Hemolysin-coregulated protein (Uncharacterized) n=1 Tax=Yersinia mollaretii (strain ATCC 43969 / DSM 18520 / CIP 103324 / CNY 7263 / WAIP 204) TaxID=349967 RepID=A0ABM9YCS7_YERMW|nr:type VI secretion system tube protein Hcp [Yersinia mollaretii]EEQ11731.1 Hemolysin-coregulated protein (uncharacterized) [Yersinia mollaretii ATCC 43969]MDN0111369.1 type VI secretion system tube protein Hcp [Yersinia mollaretii]PJE88279.1 Hcp1 family type VI secretion system effector [Yersinia mollaretii]QKJ01999.1 type VI secretion system tube protein Hcp [Yersinia mollaretii ATCC 43969]CQD41615.1 Hemolysin-coregulated protein (uncharacterized) [Yersinia mollaretii]
MAQANTLFMKITDIKGTVTDAGYKEWIAINHLDQGIYSSVGISNSESLLKSGNAGFDDVSFTKEMDSTSGALLINVAEGTAIKEIIVALTAKKAGKDYEMVRWIYENCIINRLHVSAVNAGDVPIEHLSFAFSSVKVETNTMQSAGGTQKHGPNGWDLVKNCKL